MVNDTGPYSDTAELKPVGHRHWHYIYTRRRRKALGINPKQMVWAQVVSLIGSVVAGVLLESHKETYALLIGAFVVLPGVFDLDGTLGAVLSAKINHRLEIAKSNPIAVLLKSMVTTFAVAALSGIMVASFGALLATVLFDASFSQVFLLAEGAILMSAVIGFPIIGVLSVILRKLKINPDDVVGPIESSLFDILTAITMAILVGWLL